MTKTDIVFFFALQRLLGMWSKKATKLSYDEYREIGEGDKFPYVPADILEVGDVLVSVRSEILGKMKNPSFIDVGCGFGDKVLLAEAAGFFSYGIEYCKSTWEMSQQFFPKGNKRIFHGDAFEHDFSSYDAIYLFCPIREDEVMVQLFTHIVSSAKCGAVIIEMLPRYIYRCSHLFASIPDVGSYDEKWAYVWIKGENGLLHKPFSAFEP